jgi:hypothetical protein
MFKPLISINDMLAYLVIDQCFAKYEIARLIHAKVKEMDQDYFSEKQCGRIEKLYWRIKDYEDQWGFYLSESRRESAS